MHTDLRIKQPLSYTFDENKISNNGSYTCIRKYVLPRNEIIFNIKTKLMNPKKFKQLYGY